MNKVAHRQSVEDERIIATFGHPQAHSIAPHEAKRAPQQKAEGTGQLGPAQNGEQQRVVPADQSVMRSDVLAMPVAPGCRRAHRLRITCKFVRPGHQPVGLAKCMARNSVAADVRLPGWRAEQRTPPEQASLAVPAGARQDDFAFGRGEDGLEVPTISGADRQRISARWSG